MKTQEKLYKIYHGIKYRCYNPNCKDYRWYGEKGIKLCADWDTYEKFKKWALSHGYKEGLSIDRLNHDLDYSPDNCEWVTVSENSKRMNKQYKGSPCLGRKLTDEHKIKCSKSIRKRYETDPSYKLKVKHDRDKNGNSKLKTNDLKYLKELRDKGYSRNEMYEAIGRKVNRQYFNVIIRNLK